MDSNTIIHAFFVDSASVIMIKIGNTTCGDINLNIYCSFSQAIRYVVPGVPSGGTRQDGEEDLFSHDTMNKYVLHLIAYSVLNVVVTL
jgi:hypothetical protein